MRKKIANVLRGIKYRFKHYLPRLEAEGMSIKWRQRIADAYTVYMSTATTEQKRSQKVRVVAHMDLINELMIASAYADDDFKIVEVGPAGPVCAYHGLKIVCDPKQTDPKKVQVVEDIDVA